MVLLPFFEIPYRDRLAKNVKKRYVQVIPRSTIYNNVINTLVGLDILKRFDPPIKYPCGKERRVWKIWSTWCLRWFALILTWFFKTSATLSSSQRGESCHHELAIFVRPILREFLDISSPYNVNSIVSF